MTVRYHSREGGLWPEYLCQRDGIEHAKPKCQQIPGAGIDQAIGELLVEAVSPVALEVALCVHQELQCRIVCVRTLSETQQERERQREQDRKVLSEPQRAADDPSVAGRHYLASRRTNYAAPSF